MGDGITVRRPSTSFIHAGKVASGTQFNSGQLDEEYLPEFQFAKRMKTIERMVKDPQVAGHLGFYKTPLQEAEWSVEPASEDARDLEIAGLVETHLYRIGGNRDAWTGTSWKQRLGEILDGLLEYGFALFYREREFRNTSLGSFQMYKRLVWLHPRTIDEWDIDGNDDWKGITRSYLRPDGKYVTEEFLPAEDLALYTLDIRGMNLEGKSKIRPLWRAFKLKDIAERMEAMDTVRRGALIPYGTLAAKGSVKNERENMEKALRLMRGEAPENLYVLHSENSKVGFIDPGGTPKDAAPMIERKTLDMAAAMQNQFLQMGTTKSGSRGLGDVQMAFAMLPLNALAKWVCMIENEGIAGQTSLIQEFVDNNFANVKSYPRLICERVNPQEHRETVPAMIELLSNPEALDDDPRVRWPLQAEVVARLGYKVPARLKEMAEDPETLMEERATEQAELEPELPPDVPPNQPDPGKPPPTDPPPKPEDQARLTQTIRRYLLGALSRANMKVPDGMTLALFDSADLQADIEQIAQLPDGTKVIEPTPGGRRPAGFFRHPTPFEQRFVALATIVRGLERWEARLTRTLVQGQLDIAAELVDRAVRGRIHTGNVARIGKANGPQVMAAAALQRKLRPIFRGTMRFGRVQVREELERQFKAKRMLGKMKTPTGPDAWRISTRNAELRIGLNVRKLVDSMVTEFSTELIRLAEQGATGAAMEQGLVGFMDGLSLRSRKPQGRELSSVAMNWGRNAEIQARRDAIRFVIRSEVLDKATCGPCAVLDGTKYKVNTEEYFANMPPASCAGAEMCRGFYVVVA